MALLLLSAAASSFSPASIPFKSTTQGAPNLSWKWRGFNVRYQQAGCDTNKDGPAVVLIHGLFVNADHWRRNLPALADAGCRVYAIDLLGYGYSDKPHPTSAEAKAISGENGRSLGAPEVELGTASGGRRTASVVEAHPLGSVYNFYTWAEQINDFVEEVVGADSVTLVANSIGSISALQAAIDKPSRVNGVAIVNPNFRELHVAEQPDLLRPLVMPIVEGVQSALRSNGQGLFDALAKPDTVKQILKEPYHDASQVTDELVDVLLTPLLTPGAADVVFDTLSYSAGPLPEQQLQDERLEAPVLVCWGEKDPWTPSARVLGLERFERVERVVPLPGVGHCPHDEAPQVVNPLLIDFVQRCGGVAASAGEAAVGVGSSPSPSSRGGSPQMSMAWTMAAARRGGEVRMGLFDAFAKAFENEEFKEDDRRVRASHILIKGDDDVETIMTLMGEIGERVQADPDGLVRIFADVARRESECASATSGGDLGTFGPGKMVQEFDDVLFPEDGEEPPAGAVLGPVVTDFGAHLILVTKREVNRDQIEEKLARND